MNNTLDFEAPALELEQKLTELRNRQIAEGKKVVSDVEIRKLERNLQKTRDAIYSNLSAWQKVQIARHPQRPYCLDYIKRIFTEFVELHGDRRFSDDHAMVGGFARLEEQPVMVIGTQKGRDTRENIYRNFGCAHPEGYRKALRLMQLADKFSVPIISLIDTAGAFPGVGAEERHIAESIAVNLREMFCLRVPVIAAVIGEGGSGGALGIGVANRVMIMENAYYSVISPEGCAAILWKDRTASPKAAEALRITAKDLLDFGLVDEIVPEPLCGAHHDPVEAAQLLKKALLAALGSLKTKSEDELIAERYQKFRAYGRFFETPDSDLSSMRDNE
ncbi:MAG: acetyl-CoA carboxylase carboxyltransferase subunit alpha [Verrucomicrobia bacterium]|nr:acetyl-CoA carboxylase carboxyltransferase subunit alpha [Verrucomicrobiota bacterium]MBR5738174.1 acetyl-CoA carboxylase carboxyltransferase subunit alpha [Verrucomicrobiota bacterium]MBR6461054.1 acetyl-CoA carboxylase carboxyltransferase subunit alpha [Verrucomicrobiota bacterium]